MGRLRNKCVEACGNGKVMKHMYREVCGNEKFKKRMYKEACGNEKAKCM